MKSQALIRKIIDIAILGCFVGVLSACGGASSDTEGSESQLSKGGAEADNEDNQDCTKTELATEMLASINTYRSQARDCGTTSMPAVPALTWNCTLSKSSLVHSQDMADNNFFDHTGSNGLNAGDRVTNAGYTWRAVGENIAAGQTSIDQVMQGWINSPGHCRNIMSANFTQVGAALVEVTDADYFTYWTQNFATPF